jgi:hypothetical protein
VLDRGIYPLVDYAAAFDAQRDRRSIKIVIAPNAPAVH